jgi:hypothetical protein
MIGAGLVLEGALKFLSTQKISALKCKRGLKRSLMLALCLFTFFRRKPVRRFDDQLSIFNRLFERLAFLAL